MRASQLFLLLLISAEFTYEQVVVPLNLQEVLDVGYPTEATSNLPAWYRDIEMKLRLQNPVINKLNEHRLNLRRHYYDYENLDQNVLARKLLAGELMAIRSQPLEYVPVERMLRLHQSSSEDFPVVVLADSFPNVHPKPAESVRTPALEFYPPMKYIPVTSPYIVRKSYEGKSLPIGLSPTEDRVPEEPLKVFGVPSTYEHYSTGQDQPPASTVSPGQFQTGTVRSQPIPVSREKRETGRGFTERPVESVEYLGLPLKLQEDIRLIENFVKGVGSQPS